MVLSLIFILLGARYTSVWSQVTTCTLSLTFFPQAYEDQNWPWAWNKENQTLAGNSASDRLLDIALTGTPSPKLHVMPVFSLVTNGSQVPVSCVSNASVIAASGANTASYLVTKPAQFTVRYAFEGDDAIEVGSYVEGTATQPPPLIRLTQVTDKIPADGRHCFTVFVTVKAKTASVYDLTSNTGLELPSMDLTVNRTVCFWKVFNRPAANVKVRSCGGTVDVLMTSITPKPPVMFLPDGRPLLNTTILVVGRRMGGEGEEADSLFKRYFVMQNSSRDNITLQNLTLTEGTWDFLVEASFYVTVPPLVHLEGMDTYVEKRFPRLDGQRKAMGITLLTEKVNVNLERYLPPLTVSGPRAGMAVTNDTVLQVRYDYAGEAPVVCYLDNKLHTNQPGGTCTPPIPIRFSGAPQNLTIVVMDPCEGNVTRHVMITNSSWTVTDGGGAVVQSPVTPPPPTRRNSTTPATQRSSGGMLLQAHKATLLLMGAVAMKRLLM